MDRLSRIFGKQYLFLERPLPQGAADLDEPVQFADGSIKMTRRTYGEEAYATYRKNLGREPDLGAASPFNNYIYAIDGLRIFEGNDRDIQFALSRGFLDTEKLDQLFPGWTTGSLAREPAQALLAACLVRPFTGYFDGYEHDPASPSRFWGRLGLWLPVVLSKARLVDGNVQRFVREAPDPSLTIPAEVTRELEHFTGFEGRSLSGETRHWLQEHFPAKAVTVYRGTGMNATSFMDLDKRSRDRFGVPLLGLHAGAELSMTRDRDTSWTTTPQVAREFTRAAGSLRVLLQTKLTPSQISVDLNHVPLEVRKQFVHFSQNEVIAAPGTIRVRVLSVEAEPGFLKRVERDPAFTNLTFVPRFGFAPKEAGRAARVVSRFIMPM